MTKKIIFLILTIFVLSILILPGGLAAAANYYISPNGNDTTGTGTSENPWATFEKAFKPGNGGLQGGDTLIIKDGIYTQAVGYYNENAKWNMYSPPSGSPDVYTIIKAENDGKAILRDTYIWLGGALSGTIAGGSSYIQIEGLKLLRSRINMNNSHHIKILRIGLKNPSLINTRYGGGINISCGSHHNLLEDVWVVGTFRYGISVFESYNNILRRVVARFDGNSEREPKAGLNFYGETPNGTGCQGSFITGSHDNICQNCVMLDYNAAGISSGSGLAGGSNTPHGAKNIKYYGSIALNIPATGFGLHESSLGYGNDIINSVAWAVSGCGATFRDGDPTKTILFNQFTAGNTGNGGICEFGSTLIDLIATAKNSIFYNNGKLNNGIDINDYNWYYPASLTQGTNTLTTNPGIQYITRTPDSGTGEDGVKRGATIEKRYGVDGTLWDESGYDQLTNNSLWPWPNEQRIHDDAAEADGFSYPNTDWAGGPYTIVNNPQRGFATVGQTLTRYVWEYLGNPCPADICNYAQTFSPADTNQNGKIEMRELIAFVGKWKSTQATVDDVLTALDRWLRGE